MAVQSESGHPLGFVVDVVPGSSGTQDGGYVVIAGVSGGGATPVPYSTATSMVQEGKLVIDRARLDHAPKVQQNKIEDQASWREKTDHYWSESHGQMPSGDHTGSDHMRSDDPGPGPNPDQSLPPR
jgi:hypothetical protein